MCSFSLLNSRNLQTIWVWIHLWNQDEEHGSERGEPSRRLHGPQGLEGASGVLYFSSEGQVNRRTLSSALDNIPWNDPIECSTGLSDGASLVFVFLFTILEQLNLVYFNDDSHGRGGFRTSLYQNNENFHTVKSFFFTFL